MKHRTESDEEFIHHLMDESEVKGSDALQRALLDLRSESAGPVSAPSGELAQLMARKVVALRPRRRAVKAAGVGLAVATAAGLGVSGVAAASPQFRTAADHTFQQIVQFFDPSSTVTPIEPPADTALAPAHDVVPSTEPAGEPASSGEAASDRTGPDEPGPDEPASEKDIPKNHEPDEARKPDAPGHGIGSGIAPGLSPVPGREQLDLPRSPDAAPDVAPGLRHGGNGEGPNRGQGLGHGKAEPRDQDRHQGQDKQQNRHWGLLQPNGGPQAERSDTSNPAGLPSPFSEFTHLGGLDPRGK